MSEVEQEQQGTEAPEPVQEPQEPDETPGLEPDEEEEAEQAGEPVQPPEPEEPVGLSQKEIEKRFDRIEGRATTFRNAVSEVMGEIAQDFHPCPLCTEFIPGFIPPQGPSEEAITAARGALGLPDLSNFQQAKHARQCDDCVGLGVVLSGSQVPENAAIKCTACNGSGYIIISRSTGEITAPAGTNGDAVHELPAGVNPDDPAVAELRARGFTVFPPVQIPAAQ